MVASQKPLISVALCTYNGAQYIAQQIDSILAQSYQPLEIIVIDDCSSDETTAILAEYATKANLKYGVNEKNQGFIKSFEKAISLCLGEYILLCDQDDVWKIEKIQILYDAMDTNILVYSDALLVDQDLQSLGKSLCGGKDVNTFSGSNNKAFLFKNCISGNTIMFRKELKDLCLPFPPHISFHDVWISFVAATCGSIGYVNDSLILYRQHQSNITDITQKRKTQKSRSEKLIAKEKSHQKRIDFLNSFATFTHLKLEDQEFFNKLLTFFQNYNHYYINLNLFVFLYQHKKELYAIEKDIKISRIFKDSLGLKAYKFFPFI